METHHLPRNRFIGLLGVITGIAFLLYALSKGPLTALIVTEGWHLPGISTPLTALLFHLAEEIPLVVLATLFVGLGVHLDVRGSLARAAMTVTITGFTLTIVSHLGEHLLASVTLPVLFGDTNLFIWIYYLSWAILYSGLAVYGVACLQAGSGPTWLGVLLVALLPGVLLAGLAAVLFDVFTLAGTYRVVLSVTSIVIGTWIYTAQPATSSRHTDNVILEN